MKYQVQIQYTNPAHEHVSLRRRVETITRLVEAREEQEAINRAANQQRALGFMIKEATLLKPDVADKPHDKEKGKKKKVVGDDTENTDVSVASGNVKEGFDTDPKDIAAYLVDRHGKGKVTMDHIEAYERRRDSHRPIEKHEVMKHVKKMSEEVEQIDELKKSTLGSYINKAANQVRARTGIAASFETQGTRKKDPEDYETYMGLAKDFRQGAKKRLTGIEKATAKLAKEEIESVEEAKDITKDLRVSMKAMDLRHGVDSDKRVSGYKMSPAVRAAQKKSDVLSKVEKRPQAGTLAAAKIAAKKLKEETEIQYIEEKLTAADPAGKWISDFVASDNPKFAGKTKKERINMALGAYYAAKRGKNEEVSIEESKAEGKKEARKSGEKREDILQGKVNKINMTPELDQKINGVK
jgi:soluble cytochrome b562